MCARCGVGKSCDNSFPSAVIAKEITWAQRLEFFGRNFDKPAAGFPSIGAPKEGGGGAAARQPPTHKAQSINTNFGEHDIKGFA